MRLDLEALLVDPALVDQVAPHGFGASAREPEVVVVGTGLVRMAGDHEPRVQELRVTERVRELVDVATGRVVELGAVGRELDLEIELRRSDRTGALAEEADADSSAPSATTVA